MNSLIESPAQYTVATIRSTKRTPIGTPIHQKKIEQIQSSIYLITNASSIRTITNNSRRCTTSTSCRCINKYQPK